MKSKILTLFLVLLFAGCATTATNSALLEMTTHAAVAFGASQYLKDHPKDRPKFVQARDALGLIVTAGGGTPAQLHAALSKMPITVAGVEPVSGSLSTTNKIVVRSSKGAQLAAVAPNDAVSNYVLPIARGSKAGLDDVLGPK